MQTASLPTELFIKIVNFALDDQPEYRFGGIGEIPDLEIPESHALDMILNKYSRKDSPIPATHSDVGGLNMEVCKTRREGVVKDAGRPSKDTIRTYTLITALRLYVINVILR
jgi:hypothetical protein